jgi:hypothetical protein
MATVTVSGRPLNSVVRRHLTTTMRVGDLIYFAPDIRFSDVDLTGETLPDQILARIEGYFLQAADCCIREELAFAAGVLIVTCIDAMSRFAHGPNRLNRKSGQDFRTFARTRLPSFKGLPAATLLYDNYRNGLVHEARLKNGCQFALGLNRTLDTSGAFPVVDAARLLQELRESVYALVEEMRASKPFREQLVTYVRREFAYELDAA